MSDPPSDFRFGFVGMAGAPNVGKSSLVNRLVGQKVSIVSRAPQTTRHRLCGILTEPTFQAALVDMPGILDARDRFNAALVECAASAVAGCDLILFIRSADRAGSADEARVEEILRAARRPVWEVWNKIDAKSKQPPPPSTSLAVERSFRLSARTGQGLDALKSALARRLSPGPPLFPEDEVSDRHLRFIGAELVREKLFRHLDKEVPYRAATWTEEWTERPDGRIYMRVVIQTDKASHKGIIIGAGGKMLARIGAEARAEIEELCGAPVFLELWVRVRLKWRQDPRELARLELGAD